MNLAFKDYLPDYYFLDVLHTKNIDFMICALNQIKDLFIWS